MSVFRRTALLALAVVAAVAPSAHADSVTVADPTAQNVTAYGSTSAWSRKAPDGTYHLVIRNGGVTADATIESSTAPFDPDLGPKAGGGSRIVAYSRCAAPPTTGCDVYLYDVGTGTETKAAAISGSATSEFAPSYFKGRIAFGRSGKKAGLYLYRPGKGIKRISTKTPAETDIADTRVVELYHPGGPSGGETFVRLVNYSGQDQSTIARARINGAGEGERLASPTLTRFNAFWLRISPLVEVTKVQRVGVNAHRGLSVLTATRSLSGEIGSLANDAKIPVLYTGPTGVMTVDPKFAFPGG